MGKFKVGDKVTVCTAKGWVNGTVVGCYKFNGVYLVEVPDGYGWGITSDEVDEYEETCGVILKVGVRCYWNAFDSSLKFSNHTEKLGSRPKRRIIIEITDDGAEAKYIVGKKIENTASVKRYKDDKPDDRLAAHYVVGKLFGMFGKDISFSVPTIDVEELKRATENVGFAFGHIEKVKKILLEQVYGIK